jgi:solute carrier family 25 protein 44
VNHPLAVVKTRLQHSSGEHTNSTQAALRSLARTHGFRGLYVGYVAATLGAMPGELLYVATVEHVRTELGAVTQSLTPVLGERAADGVRLFVAGAVANLSSLVLYNPVDVVVQRAFVAFDGTSQRPILDAIRATWRDAGVVGFYRGYMASLATYAPSCAVWWSVYGMSRNSLKENAQLPAWASEAAAGLVAGTASAAATHPLDTIKTRVQTGVHGPSASWWTVASSAVRSGGVSGLYRGLGARLMELGPMSAIGAVGYEMIKRNSRIVDESPALEES